MHVLTRNITSYSNAVNSWIGTYVQITDVTNDVPFASGYKVFKLLTTSSANASTFIYQSVSSAEFNGVQVNSKQFALGAWVWTDSGQAFTDSNYSLDIVTDARILQQPFSMSNVPKLVYGISSISPGGSLPSIEFFCCRSLNAYYYIAVPHFGPADGYLEMNPEWDITLDSEKIENRHRAKSGKQFIYKWGEFDSVKFGLSYVNSGARNVINNSYWANNTRVLFGMEDGSIIVEGTIGGNKPPINTYQKPYLNLWKGKIDLEGGF